MRWVQKTDPDKDVPNGDIVQASPPVNLPVYLNSEHSDVLFTVDLPFDLGVEHLVAIPCEACQPRPFEFKPRHPSR